MRYFIIILLVFLLYGCSVWTIDKNSINDHGPGNYPLPICPHLDNPYCIWPTIPNSVWPNPGNP